jgi:hypothetical protein
MFRFGETPFLASLSYVSCVVEGLERDGGA